MADASGERFNDEQVSSILTRMLEIYIEKLKTEGLKNRISRALPNNEIDSFILGQVKRRLSAKRILWLGKGLGAVDIQYKNSGIQLEPSGMARFLIKRLTIDDKQILRTVDSIIDQAQQNYIDDSDYIISKVKKIFMQLAETGIYKPKTPEEKTIYDLAVLILANYYKSDTQKPRWAISAINNLKRGDFVQDWIDAILGHIYAVASNVSENLYFDFKITFDSIFLRTLLNKKTNKGQISKLLSIMNVDIKDLIYSIAEDYLSPSFISGAGELLRDIAETLMWNFGTKDKSLRSNKKINNISKNSKSCTGLPLCITMTFGQDVTSSRAFRWYTDKKQELYLELCQNKEFVNSQKFKATVRSVPCPHPVINLGVITSYAIKKVFEYSLELNNLQQEVKYYYRICTKDTGRLTKIFEFLLKNPDKEFEFIILADPQGMVKNDYDVFLKVFKAAVKNSGTPDFVVNMGDFVDDGNNETYWQWLLNSKLWAQNVAVPLSGNHEAKLSPTAMRAGVENSIIRHFNLKALPKQSLATGAYYSYTYGDALFIVLNTNNVDVKGNLDQDEYLWALNCAKNSKSKWKILLTHKSPYSNGPHHDDLDVVNTGKQIIKLAYDANIDLVVGGHDHVYVKTPVMSCGRAISGPIKRIKKDKIVYDVYSTALGAVFIVPGTSGVKNYKVDYSTTFPTETIKHLNCPVYSSVKVKKDKIEFSSYKYSTSSNSAECMDAFILEKTEKSFCSSRSSNSIVNAINYLSLKPWYPSRDKVMEIHNQIDKLSYRNKLKIFNYKKLGYVEVLTKKYQKILNGDIEIVKNKREFLRALYNENIGTIIANCAEIKFGDKLGFAGKIIVNRDLCIRGSANLSLVNFVVKDNVMLVLGGSICIDNSRKVFSVYRNLDAVELKNYSCFIMLDYSSIKCSGGLGFRNRGIHISGTEASVFLNTLSENYASGGFIQSQVSDSYIFVYAGKYVSSKRRCAITTNGVLKIFGGKIRGLKLLQCSKTRITDGYVFGGKRKNEVPALCCMGKIRISGGTIKSLFDKGVIFSGQDCKAYIIPDHNGSVTINGKSMFIGDIEHTEDELKVNLSNLNFRENYDDIGLYSFTEGIGGYQARNFKEIRKNIKNGETIRLSRKNQNIVIIAKMRENSVKSGILIKNEASCNLCSKPIFVTGSDF